MIDQLSLGFIGWAEALIRVILAMIFGFLIGIDRDRKNKPIDFRAYMIVCVATCLLALLAQFLYHDFGSEEEFISLDFGKIIAGALTGIGFLGAGAIIRKEGQVVVGTATGASVWASGTIGLALGFGAYPIALIGFLSVAFILVIGGIYMKFFQNKSDQEENVS
jgi:putative Mg2+ transporter-C (MgtC) family protein